MIAGSNPERHSSAGRTMNSLCVEFECLRRAVKGLAASSALTTAAHANQRLTLSRSAIFSSTRTSGSRPNQRIISETLYSSTQPFLGRLIEFLLYSFDPIFYKLKLNSFNKIFVEFFL